MDQSPKYPRTGHGQNWFARVIANEAQSADYIAELGRLPNLVFFKYFRKDARSLKVYAHFSQAQPHPLVPCPEGVLSDWHRHSIGKEPLSAHVARWLIYEDQAIVVGDAVKQLNPYQRLQIRFNRYKAKNRRLRAKLLRLQGGQTPPNTQPESEKVFSLLPKELTDIIASLSQ